MRTKKHWPIKVRTISRELVLQAPMVNYYYGSGIKHSGYPWAKVKILGDLNDGFLLVDNCGHLQRVSVTVYVTDKALEYGWMKGGQEGAAAFGRAYQEGNRGFRQLFTVTGAVKP